jgi:uncharacterized protein
MMGRTESREKYVKAARRASPEAKAGVGAFMGTVYAWMTMGLALSAFIAYECAQSEWFMQSMMAGSGLFWALILAPFILIFVHAFRMEKASMLEGGFWYLLTTGIMGTWLSSVALQATESVEFATTVYEALFVTVGMFAGMSMTGWITKKDLSAAGNFLIAAVWGLIAVGILNAFVLQSASVNLLYHIGGVVIFAGLTAYDTQQIKGYYYERGAHHGLAIWGALTLYLDFVNIFLHLLRLMGGSSSSD